MFDVGLSELLLCFIVALVVLGPERLPGVARAVGRWTGMAKAYMRNLSSELDREAHTAELKQQFAETQKLLQEQTAALQQTAQQMTSSATDTMKSVTGAADSAPKPPP